jgi:hypothetical protein
MSKNHRSGKKMGGKHTTIIDAAEKVIDYLNKNANVSNIIAGRIKMGLKTSQHSMKITRQTGCLAIKVRGTASIQDIMVFSQNLEQVQCDLENKFPQ